MKDSEDSPLEIAHHGNFQQSAWLQVTLSDLNKRMRNMMSILEEGGKSSEVHCKRRLELIQMLEGLDRSYRSLAEKYDHLMSNSQGNNSEINSGSSSDTANKKRVVGISDHHTLQDFDSYPIFYVGDPFVQCNSTNSDFEYLNNQADQTMSAEQCMMKLKTKLEIRENQMDEAVAEFFNRENTDMEINDFGLVQDHEGLLPKGHVKKSSWSEFELQMTRLIAENQQQQTKLARRNVEKKMAIDRLQLQVEQLKEENRALQSCVSCLKVGEKHNQPRTSTLRKLFSGKFYSAGCS